MTIASGAARSIAVKKQSALGTPATGSGGQLLRRVTWNVVPAEQLIRSPEIVTSMQRRDVRSGSRRVGGPLAGVLSPSSYELLFAAALRKDFVNGATSGPIDDVTAEDGPPGTFTRATGSWLTAGFKVGDVVRATGFAGGGEANNNRNYRITALTATVMTVAEAVVDDAAGDTVTFTVVGQKTLIPSTGHTNDLLTFEDWFADISRSHLYTDVRVDGFALELRPDDTARVTFNLLGRDRTVAGAQVLTTPTAAPATNVASSNNGALRLDGADLAVLTGMSLNVGSSASVLPVIFSKISPDVFRAPFDITGQLTVAFEDDALTDLFTNETEFEILARLDLGAAINADFLTIKMPRVKIGVPTIQDAGGALVMTAPFEALENVVAADAATDASALVLQDSTLS